VETNNNQEQGIEVKKDFVAPTTASDFPPGETTIKHTYENGNSVAFVLLKNGDVARIREGKGSDVEKATMEAGKDKDKYLTAMMAATVTINGKVPNMFELAEGPMKDYLNIQAAFSEINF